MTRWPLLSLLVLAACPKQGGGPTAPAQPGVGCPTASDFYMATYVQPPEGVQGYTGWVLPLHTATVASVQGQPGFTTIDASAAAAAGMPAPPPSVWVMPPGAAMCKATAGRYYAAAIEGSTPSIAYCVELTGCPAPKEPGDVSAIALVSVSPPSECKVAPLRPIATRLGEVDDKGTWSPPTKETPLPAEVASLVPADACTGPGCEKLWSVAALEQGGKPVAYGAAVNWVQDRPQPGACRWQTTRWSGSFVVGPDGALTKLTEGQDHTLALTFALSDRSGRTLLVAQGPGEYTAYDLSGGAATVGRHLVWLVEEPEAYEAVDHLGPECPPPTP